MKNAVIIDVFDKLLNQDFSNIKEISQYFIKKICEVFQLKWCVAFLIDCQDKKNKDALLLVSSNDLKKIYNIKKRVFKETLIYKTSLKQIKKRWIKKKIHNPEYCHENDLCCYYISSKNYNFLIEFPALKNEILNEDSFIKLLNLFLKLLNKNIENEDSDRKISELAKLIEISKILNSTLHLDVLLSRLFSEVKNILRSEGCSLMLKSIKTGELKFQTVKGKKSNIIKEFTIPAGKGIAGWILRNKKSVLVNNVEKDRRFYSGSDMKSGFKTRNIVGAPLLFKNDAIGLIEAVNKVNKEKFDESDKKILTSLANLAAIAIKNAQYYLELQDLFLSTVKSLSAAIDAKDPYTKGHSERVTKYSIKLAKELKFDNEFIKQLEWAASLHDIGKIGIDEVILSKPGKLNDREYNIIKTHPLIGESIMKPIREFKAILPGIRNHHERWDGKGYPDRIAKESIPLMARIIALADTYDAMTSNRPYRSRVQTDIALNEIHNCMGTQFDPNLTKIFVKIIKKIK